MKEDHDSSRHNYSDKRYTTIKWNTHATMEAHVRLFELLQLFLRFLDEQKS